MFIESTATKSTAAAYAEHVELVCSIKGTALNKGRARVWIERDLSAYGFERGTPIKVEFESNYIAIVAKPISGADRRVAGRTRNGKDIAILDICFDNAEREAMFKGAAKLNVHALAHGLLVITAKEA